MPKRAAWSRSMVMRRGGAADLLVGRDVAQHGQLAQLVQYLRRVGQEFIQIGILQRVLEFGLRDAGADTHVRDSLHEHLATLDLGQFRAVPSDVILQITADALIPWLQRDEYAAGVQRVAGGRIPQLDNDRRRS